MTDSTLPSLEAQAAAFYQEIVERGSVWTIRDADGIPVPESEDEEPAMPFWSSRERVEDIIATAAAFEGFSPVEIELEVFRDRWIPGMQRDGLLVGLNWSGENATGYDITPAQAAAGIRQALSRKP